MAKMKIKDVRNTINDALASDLNKEELVDVLRYIKAKTGDAEWQLRPNAICQVEVECATFHFENINERNKIEIRDD